MVAFFAGILVSQYRVTNLDVNIVKEQVISEIEGTIKSVKPSLKGAQVVLAETRIAKLADAGLFQVRVSIPKKYNKDLLLNDKVRLLAKLYQPEGSVIPGSYDFSFNSYFAGIGATGYAMSEVTLLNRKVESASFISFYRWQIYKLRKHIYERLVQIGGKIHGNFLAAILLGETKGIDRELMQQMRWSGISHILCVSGLHLSLIAMLFFVITRFLLNLSDYLAFNFNIKVIAAVFSLIGSYGYLELSGMQIAATRAFIMTAIFIIGVIIGRKAYPIRSIAIAATFILSLNPEYLFSPSFQLSFIAVLSLLSGYEFYLRNKWILGVNSGILAQIKFYLASNIYSSFLASIVTAPVVISQFYTFATYSIPMNLVAVPIMSFFLMPLAILSLVLMPLNLDSFVIKVMAFFIDIIVKAATIATEMPGAVWYFGYITPSSLIVFLLGFFWLCFWQTSWRLWGLGVVLISTIMMFNSPKPDLILNLNDNIIAINKAGTLEIYADKISGFNRQYWANWFGQKDAEVYSLEKQQLPKDLQRFTAASGKTIAINYPNSNCLAADVQINLGGYCNLGEVVLDYSVFKEPKVVAIFCSTKCYVREAKSFFK